MILIPFKFSSIKLKSLLNPHLQLKDFRNKLIVLVLRNK